MKINLGFAVITHIGRVVGAPGIGFIHAHELHMFHIGGLGIVWVSKL